VALITDGRFSGGTRGPCIGHIAPEAAIGGPLALVRDGDLISLDLHRYAIDILVPAEELERRRKEWSPRRKKLGGVLSRYASGVGQADKGAVFPH
jgi:dihydroxy-acid dehydratase